MAIYFCTNLHVNTNISAALMFASRRLQTCGRSVGGRASVLLQAGSCVCGTSHSSAAESVLTLRAPLCFEKEVMNMVIIYVPTSATDSH